MLRRGRFGAQLQRHPLLCTQPISAPTPSTGGGHNLVARPSLGANQVGELLFSSRGVRPAPQRAAESSHTRFKEGGLENTRVYILNSNRNHVFEG